MKPIDMLRATDLSTAKTVQEIATACNGSTVSGSVSLVVIQPITKGVYFTDTGIAPDISDLTDPTKVCGMYVAAGGVWNYDGDWRKLKFLQESATATMNLGLYSNQGI